MSPLSFIERLFSRSGRERVKKSRLVKGRQQHATQTAIHTFISLIFVQQLANGGDSKLLSKVSQLVSLVELLSSSGVFKGHAHICCHPEQVGLDLLSGFQIRESLRIHVLVTILLIGY